MMLSAGSASTLSSLRIVIAGFAAWVGLAAAAPAQTLRVKVDSSAEILALMFRVAGAQEYSQGTIQPYIRQADSAFKPFALHPAIAEIQRLRRGNGVAFDAVMSMAAHVTDPIEFRERVPFDSPAALLDSRWRGADSRAFLALARDFARDARVAEFLARQRPVYDSAAMRLQRLIDRRANLRWFNAFFGGDGSGTFVASPLIANAGGNFGPRFATDTLLELHAYLGMGTADSAGFPTIPDGLLPTIVHEFNHSFVNRLVESHREELRKAGERVYAPVAASMRAQAYGNAQTMLNESVVRAAVIRYLMANDGQAAADIDMRDQRRRSFIWMPALVALLGEYEANRAKYPTLQAFMPRIVSFYQDLATHIDADVAAFESQRPSITRLSIADRAADVDPALSTVTVEFDRPMGDRVSMNRNAGDQFPTISGWTWDAAHTTLALTVKLEPNTSYGIRFTGNGFATRDGHPLLERVLRFKTR